MKNTIGLFLALLGFSGFGATYSDPVMVSSNGTLQAPTNFFLVNTGAITAALTASGWSTSSGNANTNAANAWSVGYTQTFLGPVMWSTTNAIAEVAGKQGLDSDLTALAAISGVSGDIIFHNGTNWTRLPKGTNWQPLQLSSGFPTWALVDDDSVSFDDTDNLWTATVIGLALSELNDSINAGVPNGIGAKVHWSQLLGVPVGFADGTDDGTGGGSGTVTSVALSAPTIFSVSGSPVTVAGTLSFALVNQDANTIWAGPTTGAAAAPSFRALFDNDIPSGIARDSEVSAGYQPLDADLTDLSDGSLTGSKVGTGIDGGNITTGTVADARIDAAIARDSEVSAAYQPLDADLTDLADGSLTGSKVGTGIDGGNVTTGTVADARIDAAIARLAGPALTGTLNWTNATSLAIPAGNDPTTDAAGEIALDRNGDFLELYVNSAAESRVIPTLHKCSATIIDPDGIQAVEDAIPLLPVESTWAPHGITIKDIYVKIDAAVSYAVTLEEWTDPATASSDIETVTVSSGTEAEDDGTLSDASVAAGSIVFVDLPTTAANFLTVTFTYIINPGN